jgi:cleavage and polyadenylation specificity factor subunit 4
MAIQLSPHHEIIFSFDPWLKSNLNFGEPNENLYQNGRLARQRSVVCKHWLKGLCKKGDACEFLHEYNIRRMPECKSSPCFSQECLYRHIDPASGIEVCPLYERGFCPLGPDCSKRHMKGNRFCQMFLTGFCPFGKECYDAH